MPKAFSEREKKLIRQRLLQAGDQQFSAYGLRKTNVEALAQAAQISKGAFYLFYESKEALFMDVVEAAEQRYRQHLLAAVDLPGPSPRARLTAIFQQSFALLKSMPVLQRFTNQEFELLLRKLPAEELEAHVASDLRFFEALTARCQAAGIPIRVRAEQVSRLIYPLVSASLRGDDWAAPQLSGGLEQLLELVAAYCLGEIELETEKPAAETTAERSR
jgi:AcrR family transcriptional regulator